MTSSSKSVASRQSSDYSFDSIDNHISSLPEISRDEAVGLAKALHQGLQPHIKDRMYRFKSYKACFKHSQALSWAIKNISKDEMVAVQRLNELIDWGLVCHVVDPAKRFRVKECRRLYFRIVDDALNEEQQLCNQVGTSHDRHRNHNLQLIRNSSGKDDNLKAMQSKVDGLDHVLEETVKELNAANGRLELMHQRVCTLVSQQLSLYGLVFMLLVYNLHELSPWHTSFGPWFSSKGCLAAFLIIMLGRCSLAFSTSWSLSDYTRIVAVEMVEEESTSEESTPSTIISKTYTDRPSFTRIVSERLGVVVGKKSTRAQAAAREKNIILSRESYSLPAVETWPHRPLLVCVNTPVSINIKVPHYGLGPCTLGKPFKFSSDLFEGTCLIRIKESNSDDILGDSNYFSGRKRIFQSVVQGRFKEEGLRVSDVLTGHEFARPMKNLPHPWILKTASNFIGRVAPGSRVVVHTDQPYVEAILAGTSQAVRGGEIAVDCTNYIFSMFHMITLLLV